MTFAITGFLPAWRTLNTDFPNYYIAASLYREGVPLGRVYEWKWFQREKDHLNLDQPLVGFMPNPPLCALPVLPLTYFRPLIAKRIWLAINVIFLVCTLLILHRDTTLPWRRLLLIAALCVLPLQTNFICGQYYVMILFLVSAAYRCSLNGYRFTSGVLLSIAGCLKLFPAVFLLLFLRKRDWRSALGLIGGIASLTIISISMFGMDVHRVWIAEVLPRALHGDIIDPYALGWASFSSLWHRWFLFEPQLNPAPFVQSPILYAIAQAATTSLLLFSFLTRVSSNRDRKTTAFDWSVFLTLLLLLSSMPSPYHYCVLIFTAIVAADALVAQRMQASAIAVIGLFALACAPTPDSFFHGYLVLTRLFGTLLLYLVLLYRLPAAHRLPARPGWIAALALALFLFVAGLASTRGRADDFSRRLSFPAPGYSASSPVVIGSRIVFLEMVNEGYRAMSFDGASVSPIPSSNDVLSLASTSAARSGYFAQVNQESTFVSAEDIPVSPSQFLVNGENPALSPDGKRIVFSAQLGAVTSIWIMDLDKLSKPRLVLRTFEDIMDLSFGPGDRLLASVGPVSDPRVVLIPTSGGPIKELAELQHPARYPRLSPDGKLAAYAQRQRGSWQLVVHNLVSGHELQLTRFPCNATEPVWQNENTLLYATDCGRGLGLTALARVSVPGSY